MNNLQIFKNTDFGEIRTIEENGKIMFCGSDVAKALGYKDPINTLKQHCRIEGVAFRHILTNGGKQKVKFISEGNLYRLITQSKLPSALKFEKWVFDDVLPSIRKTGQYNVNAEIPSVAYLNGCANLLNSLRRIMRDQNSSPYKIALQTQLLCNAYGIPIIDKFIEPTYEQILIGE